MGRVLYSSSASTTPSKQVTKSAPVIKTKDESKHFGTKILFCLATAFICCGLIWFAFLNSTRYENLVGKAKTYNVLVSGIEKQTDVEEYENASAEIERYHLTARYEVGGVTKDIVLNESYIDEEQAKSFVGEKRHIAIDTASWKNVTDKGISWMCGIPVCVGFICYIVAGFVVLNRKK